MALKALYLAFALLSVVDLSVQQLCQYDVDPASQASVQHFGDQTCYWRVLVPAGKSVLAQCNFGPSGNQITITNNEMQQSVTTAGTKSITFNSQTTIAYLKSSTASTGYFACTFSIQAGQTPTTQKPPAQCDCGWRKDYRIVGGREAEQNEFPFMAGLVNNAKKIIQCGCAIISNKHVLTAAHCVFQEAPSAFSVVIGEHNTALGDGTEQLIPVSDYRYPSDFAESTNYNDIAIVLLSSTITFGPKIGPICLPYNFANQDFTGTTVQIMGWGSTSFSGQRSNALKVGQVQVTDSKTCSNEFPKNYYEGVFCTTGYPTDACQFDSGGPVVFYDYYTNRYFLMGLITFGQACANGYPGGNTKISYHLNWIDGTIQNYQKCVK